MQICETFKQVVRTICPEPLLLHYRRWRYGKPSKVVFTEIFENRLWEAVESASGIGSDLDHTEQIRMQLPLIVQELSAKSILDGPCGDFNWMKHVRLDDCQYIGVDIVDEIVTQNQDKYGGDINAPTFRCLDLCTDPLPQADLILCRDCIIHLSYKDTFLLLENFQRSGAKYIMTTTYPSSKKNHDIVTGSWRPINLLVQPFNFPPPMKFIIEERIVTNGEETLKGIGLWQLSDIHLR